MAKNIVQGVLSMVGRRIATFAMMFVGIPIIVRVLGPSGYGNYSFALSVFSLLMVFVSSGVTEGVQKYVGEEARSEDWQEQVIGFYLRAALLLAVVGSAFLVVFVWSGLLERLLGRDLALVFYLLAGLVFTSQFMEFTVRVLRGFSLERYSESLRVLHTPIFLVAGIGLAVLGYGVPGMFVGNMIGGFVVTVTGLYIISRRVDLTTAFARGRMDVPHRELVSFNVLNVGLMLLMMSLYHVDVIMIRTFVGSESTAYYKAALGVAEFLWFVPMALQSMFIHSMSNLWSSGQVDRVEQIAGRTTRYALLFSALLAVGIASLGGRFLPVYYGPQYTESLLPLLILLPGAVGFAVARPIYGIAQGKGNLKPMVAATAGAAALNIVMNALLIPQFGIAGAAAATSVGYVSMLGFHVWSARELGFRPLSDLRVARTAATIVLAGAPVLFLAYRIQSDALAFAVVPPLGAVLFFGFAVTLGALDREELGDIVASLPTPIRTAIERIYGYLPSGLPLAAPPGD